MAGHPTDVLVEDLFRLYADNAGRLEAIVQAGLRRGIDPARLGQPDAPVGTATAAYRARARAQAEAIADELFRTGSSAGPIVIERAYRSGLVAVDRTLGGSPDLTPGATGAFGRIHVRAVDSLAANLTGSLEAGAANLRENIGLVFDRADALEGALPNRPGRSGATVGGLRFLGRRANDPYRKVALETVAGGIIGLDTRRQVSATLARRLVTEGVTDALTGFVDRSGRRWSLPSYAAMVARTTTREAMTAGTTNRLREHGLDLVTISEHAHAADECSDYDGQTFSLDGATPGYPVLDELPPFHPNCAHVATPAAGNLDDFEAELATAAAEASGRAPAGTGGRPVTISSTFGSHAAQVSRKLTPTHDPPAPPFSANAAPTIGPGTLERLEAERVSRLIAADPGPEYGAAAARAAEWESEAAADAKRAASDLRKRRMALKKTLDPDLATDVFGGHGRRAKAWATEQNVAERMLAGELTPADVDELAYEEWRSREERAAKREVARSMDYGLEKKPIPCFVCGHFKARPADVCQNCGDDPVQVGTGFAEFNRAFGYGGDDTRQGMYGIESRQGIWNG